MEEDNFYFCVRKRLWDHWISGLLFIWLLTLREKEVTEYG
jgi:hypothetical protein